MTQSGGGLPGRQPLALTMGDPAGIGPEITVLAWQRRLTDNIPAFALYADPDLVRDTIRRGGGGIPVETIDSAQSAPAIFKRALPVIRIPLENKATPGEPDVDNASATIAAIDRAVADVAKGDASAVVTNPIAKSVLYRAAFRHPGHTEYLGSLANRFWPGAPAHPVMMIAAPELRVVPVTIHVPLVRVAALLSTELIIETCRTVAEALKRDFGISRPRLALTGLNPHAGEDGTIGTEDRDVVAPAIERLRTEGIDASGPYAADTLFHAAARCTYDVAVAMYHDQALIPIKTLAFDEGVNVTLGLPFVRTSPDHGTAFGIAGKGTASPKSLIAAIKTAHAMATCRSRANAL